MSRPAFSMSDLQSGAKKLNTVEHPSELKASLADAKPSYDSEALVPLEELYVKYDGDLDLIFEQLQQDPSKAKKPHHRPKNCKEFAEKYLEGYYTVISTDSNSHSHSDYKQSSHK